MDDFSISDKTGVKELSKLNTSNVIRALERFIINPKFQVIFYVEVETANCKTIRKINIFILKVLIYSANFTKSLWIRIPKH